MSIIHIFLKKYNHFLIKYPLKTKCLTSSIILSSSVFTANNIKNYYSNNKNNIVNYKKIFLFGILCGTQKASLMHYFYNRSIYWNIPKKIIVTSVIIDPINYISAIMFNNKIIKDKSYKNGINLLKKNFYDIYTSGLYIWPMAQLINFNLIPLQWRVFYFNIISYMWNCWLAYEFI